MSDPKVLFLDIETKPMQVSVWGLQHNDFISVDQIIQDWSVLSWAAKWRGSSKVLQQDLRAQKTYDNDRPILGDMWELLNEADIVVTQNGKKFDIPKLNSRFVINGMKPPSSFQHIDTRALAKKHFGFTSNSLEYLSEKLCKKYRKLKHKKFPGRELWVECLKGNQAAWKEMARYNKHDVLTLEELYQALAPWDNAVNFNVYYGDAGAKCTCGSTKFKKNGYAYTSTGKYQRYACKSCGSELKARTNLVDKEVRETMLRGTKR